MVKAAVMAGGRGRNIAKPGEEIDYGMPLTHPIVMIPLIGLIIMGTMALITCFCKCLPHRVPDNLKIFGKRSANENMELQLGRRTHRRTSDLSQASAKANGKSRSKSRTPSFNSNSKQRPNYPSVSTTNETMGSNTLQVQNLPSAPPRPPALTLPYGLSPAKELGSSQETPPPPPYNSVIRTQQYLSDHLV